MAGKQSLHVGRSVADHLCSAKRSTTNVTTHTDTAAVCLNYNRKRMHFAETFESQKVLLNKALRIISYVNLRMRMQQVRSNA